MQFMHYSNQIIRYEHHFVFRLHLHLRGLSKSAKWSLGGQLKITDAKHLPKETTSTCDLNLRMVPKTETRCLHDCMPLSSYIYLFFHGYYIMLRFRFDERLQGGKHCTDRQSSHGSLGVGSNQGVGIALSTRGGSACRAVLGLEGTQALGCVGDQVGSAHVSAVALGGPRRIVQKRAEALLLGLRELRRIRGALGWVDIDLGAVWNSLDVVQKASTASDLLAWRRDWHGRVLGGNKAAGRGKSQDEDGGEEAHDDFDFFFLVSKPNVKRDRSSLEKCSRRCR